MSRRWQPQWFCGIHRVGEYVRATVDKEMQGRQTPWLSRKELFGDLPVARVN
jgi:hypothetical protein